MMPSVRYSMETIYLTILCTTAVAFFIIYDPCALRTVTGGNIYEIAMDQLNSERVAQDDLCLIRLLRDYYIESPTGYTYSLKDHTKEDYSANGQSEYVDHLLNFSVRITSIFPTFTNFSMKYHLMCKVYPDVCGIK